ncbi:uncharacterized protein BDZ99DRAFT_461440 [Mytilinidion resinicola]|uniref:DUF7730 domain-containing protein n=1 Tax=Mytilinidion resinicola TaxID=574789 RepID=A0A6A6YR17_9PEZI|nr:uncharacterized protein BDZ99DRAFT_461440 [Mytilinidion resinicola]KAF2811352.1 hypothetical protein BDZ99DRAFT_461440 [Mytilinidion resinicola]
MSFLHPAAPQEVPFLLRLPIELRQHIYSYILPSTTSYASHFPPAASEPSNSEFSLTFVRETLGEGVWKMQRTLPNTSRKAGNDIVWRRGWTALLAVNRQIHEECVDLIYGDNTFVIDVAYDSIKFRYRWVLPSNLTPSQSYSFLDHFSQRNLLRIRNYIVNVEHVDSYTGMIKYNCGGRGLTAGIRQQVQNLVELLALVPSLHRVHVHLIDGAISRVRFPSGRLHRVQDKGNCAAAQTVLDPLFRLYGVRKAAVTGVTPEYMTRLEEQMTGGR